MTTTMHRQSRDQHQARLHTTTAAVLAMIMALVVALAMTIAAMSRGGDAATSGQPAVNRGPNADLAANWPSMNSRHAATATTNDGPNADLPPSWPVTINRGPNADLARSWPIDLP